MVLSYIKLLRIHHWVKNLFIFIPIFFAGHITDLEDIYHLLGGFISFSLVASFVYIFNDLFDIEKDKLHPEKRYRPIPSGEVSKTTAIVFASLCFVVGYWIALKLAGDFLIILSGYLVINVLYTVHLKKIAIVDISLISIGFLLRILAGGVLGEVPVSKWLVLLTFFLSMILALAKRRNDLIIMEETGVNSRKVVEHYNLQFIDISLTIMAVITVVSYIMYTVSEEVVTRLNNEYVYLTSLLVVVGLLRYLQLTLVYQKSASPVRILLKDIFIQVIIILWGGIFFVILYL
jgi:4-hydroxybenzoate polyprenyltransferase